MEEWLGLGCLLELSSSVHISKYFRKLAIGQTLLLYQHWSHHSIKFVRRKTIEVVSSICFVNLLSLYLCY